MAKKRIAFPLRLLGNSFLAVLAVGATTVPLALVGRQTLGEAVIALLYLVPVALSAGRWGLIPGLGAALSAALCFDFLFIPPFYTFVVGRLEGWLVLAIFLVVAVLVVETIQASLTKAREAVFMYEMSSTLAGKRTQEAAARTVAQQIRQLFQAGLVRVTFQPENHSPSTVVSEPKDAVTEDLPDRTIPLENTWGLVGEIQIWRGEYADLPPEDSRLLINFAAQTAQALERTRLSESRDALHNMAAKVPGK